MIKPSKKYYSNFLKEETSPIFSKEFKSVIFNEKLSYGSRIYLCQLMTIPIHSEFSDRKVGRKLGVTGHQIAKWKKEIEKNNVVPIFEQ